MYDYVVLVLGLLALAVDRYSSAKAVAAGDLLRVHRTRRLCALMWIAVLGLFIVHTVQFGMATLVLSWPQFLLIVALLRLIETLINSGQLKSNEKIVADDRAGAGERTRRTSERDGGGDPHPGWAFRLGRQVRGFLSEAKRGRD